MPNSNTVVFKIRLISFGGGGLSGRVVNVCWALTTSIIHWRGFALRYPFHVLWFPGDFLWPSVSPVRSLLLPVCSVPI